VADNSYHFAFDINGDIEFGDEINSRFHFWHRVERFNGIEGISRPFHFEIFLAQEGGLTYDDTLIGQPATLHIRRGKKGDVYRFINGIVSRFLFLGYSGNISAYYAELVPSIWYLTQQHQSRIFQDMSVPEIIEEVLKQVLPQPHIHYDFKLIDKEKYKKREFCVQYRESDFDFISRLMEEEGIFYFFKHHQEPIDTTLPPAKRPYPFSHTLVLGNSPTCFPDIIDKEGTPAEEKSNVKYTNAIDLIDAEEHIYDFNYNFQILPSQVILCDHNYNRNSNMFSSSRNLSKRFEPLKFYDYPGKFDETDEGNRLADIRIEELRTKYESGIGHSNCLRLVPGSRFTLSGHDQNKSFNIKHLLLTVSHTGRQATTVERRSDVSKIFDLVNQGIDALLAYIPKIGPLSIQQIYHEYSKSLSKAINTNEFFYGNEFGCIPATTIFRPPRLTSKPVVQGPQTATVVGEGDDRENKKKKVLYMDEKGRTKVKFHWDRREKDEHNCSCWIRVASNYAGANHGCQFHPLVGDEVVVHFLEGDPDKPIIVGSVYNGDNPPLLTPTDMTENIILTPYQHRLLLSDQERKITLNTGGGKDRIRRESLTMYDEDNKYGNAIYLRTAEKHEVYLTKNPKLSQVTLMTEQGHQVTLQDAPSSGIMIRDKTEKLSIELNSDREQINIKNETDKQVLIECKRGNVSVVGGGVDVAGGVVNINGSKKVKIESDSIECLGLQITVNALEIDIVGGTILLTTPETIILDAPTVKCTGTIQCEALITKSVTSASYTPGVGNLV
jgi:type VI secretion system VgrG family protein